jgi:leader peptidase (prepilin peptidase)/N-methyltransferase
VTVVVSELVWVSALAALLGLVTGAGVNRAAGAYPWRRGEVPSTPADGGTLVASSRLAVRPPVVEVGTAALFVLTALSFGPAWDLPAFLLVGGAGMLLALIDLRHLLLPDRVLLPALGGAAGLFAVAAAGTGEWEALLRAGLGAVALFTLFLVLALISPRSLGMGDVKLSALLGLSLGWLGWPVLALGAAAGFVVQAVLALVLLAGRRVGWRGELPFGPAMLLGAILAVAVR